MPCDYSYVQPITIQLDNTILINAPGAQMLQNVLNALIPTEVYSVEWVQAELEIRNSAGRRAAIITAEQVVIEPRFYLLRDLLPAILERLAPFKFQMDTVEEFDQLGATVQWYESGEVTIEL